MAAEQARLYSVAGDPAGSARQYGFGYLPMQIWQLLEKVSVHFEFSPFVRWLLARCSSGKTESGRIRCVGSWKLAGKLLDALH